MAQFALSAKSQAAKNQRSNFKINKIHLIGGEKGGVGKSVVARVVAQYMIDKNIPFLGFDTDRSHGSLLRFYTDYASPVVVDKYESLDTIVEAAVENPDKRILRGLSKQSGLKWCLHKYRGGNELQRTDF